MGKIENKFRELKAKKKKAFIVYIPFGFPSISLSGKIITSLDKSGVDFIEVGFPFSDPLADGTIIQKATQISLKNGVNPDYFFAGLEKLKSKVKAPLIILTYYNPVYMLGLKKFLKKSKDAGVGGIMIVDLPIEEAGNYIKEAQKYELDTIFFVTPATEFERAQKIMKLCRGFVYYVSVTGITGPKDFFIKSVLEHIKRLKSCTDIAICVGFGIHNREQVRKLTKESDGIIVGSAIVKYIDDHYQEKNFLNMLSTYVKGFQE
ncbi:MAG: tryptophan synthase subunit alpha [Candidatus Omnitrophica bacterium]|nr:tryptophan synthase subunit alpha [Candidatus Omnitrophota bacterium]